MSLLSLEVVKRKTLGPQVKEYGEKYAALREAQSAVKAAVQGSEETEADLTNLYEELSVQRAILDKCGGWTNLVLCPRTYCALVASL